jgi:hypothetical protein
MKLIVQPEWVYTHVLGLIKAHSQFLIFKLQPLLNEHQMSQFDAKEEFIKGLIHAVNHKFTKDMRKLLQTRDILFYTINEAINFEKTLKNTFNYQTDDTLENTVSSLEPFIVQEPLEAWLELERECTCYQLSIPYYI